MVVTAAFAGDVRSAAEGVRARGLPLDTAEQNGYNEEVKRSGFPERYNKYAPVAQQDRAFAS